MTQLKATNDLKLKRSKYKSTLYRTAKIFILLFFWETNYAGLAISTEVK